MKAVLDTGLPPAFVVSLHDVSPLSWPLYREFLHWLDALGDVRSSLLVVPDFHRRADVANDKAFRTAMSERQARGDELVLHGCTHTDDAPAPRDPIGILQRRILTHEGEFAALGYTQSKARIQTGLALFREQGWQAAGFVPPGWMSNPGSRAAINEAGFAYRTDSQALYDLPSEQRFVMPTMVMSSRSGWRRQLFAMLNQWRLSRYREAPLIRLAIHPVDLGHASSRAFWMTVIRQLHHERRAITKRQWLNELRAMPAVRAPS